MKSRSGNPVRIGKLPRSGPRKRPPTDRARLAAIVEGSEDAIISKSLDGIIRTWNIGAERLFGYRQEEVVDKSITILIPPDRIDEETRILARLRRGQRIEHYETIRAHKDGHCIAVSISVSPIRDEGGKVIGASKIARDISDRRRAQVALLESEQRIRAIVNTAVDAIITIDQLGTIESANPATEKLFGYNCSEMIGQNVRMLMPEPYHGEHDDYLRRFMRTGVPRIIGIGRDVSAVRKDGTRFPIHLSVSAVSLESRTLFTGIIHDLSARRQLELDIVQAAVEEQRRIGQDIHDGLCQDLVGIAFQADFIARQLQAAGFGEAAGVNKVAAAIRDAAVQARHLSHGLNPVDLRGGGLAVALEALAMKISQTSAVVCTLDAGSVAHAGDDARVTHVYRIAQEAVNNALKHGKPRRIAIRLAMKGGRIVLTVADDGVGLPSIPRDTGRPARKAAATSTPLPQSDGIGLRSMQYRAQMIGADFDIRPRRGRGTVVTCSVPVQPAKSANGDKALGVFPSTGRGNRPIDAPERTLQ
jgi:PAS domain S-box-containing protein